MNTKRLTHYLIFGALSVASLVVAVLAFVNLNKLIDNYRLYQSKAEDLSNQISPLKLENDKLNEILNNPDITCYCEGIDPECTHFYTDDECRYFIEDYIEVFVCFTCSVDEDNLVYVDDFENHRQDLIDIIARNQQKINELEPQYNEMIANKNNVSNQMPLHQTLAIVFTPCFVVLTLVALVSSKD